MAKNGFTNMSKSSNHVDWEKLFDPRAIGIIGASKDPTGGGYFVQCMLGKIRVPMYLFNPKYAGQELFGYKCYASVLDDELKDKPIDYVILGVKAKLCPMLMEELGKKGVPFVTIFASGFREVGNDDLEQQVIDIANKYGIRIIGPNCIGVYNPSAGMYFGSNQSKKAGNYAGVFQSGGLAVNAAQLAVAYGCYVSKMISVGNAVDLSHPDFLEYFLNDNDTKIIGLYLENFKNIDKGRQFFEAAKACNLNRKPVILWRAGYGEATKKAILSHTGGLAGSNQIWKAVAKQTGCSLVESSIELAATASAFKLIRLPASRNIGLIGIGGGSTIEAGDLLEKNGMIIPTLTEKTQRRFARFLPDVNTNFANPLDLGAQGALPHIYYRTIITLNKDPNVDAIVFVKDPERFGNLQSRIIDEDNNFAGVDLNRMFIKYISKAKRLCEKPLICVMLKISEGFQEYKSRYNFKLKLLNRNVPVYESFDLAGKVLNNLCTYKEFLEKHGEYPKK